MTGHSVRSLSLPPIARRERKEVESSLGALPERSGGHLEARFLLS